MILLRFLFVPIVIVHEAPVLAAVPAAAFAAMAWAARSRPLTAPAFLWPAVTAAMWAASGLYEVYMRDWERKVSAPIRVDLLALWPILAVASVAAAIAFVRGRLSRSP